jgi:hypothetical protein
MTCSDKDALGGDWCGAPPLVWVELVPPPFWLEPAVVVDMFTGLLGLCRRLGVLWFWRWWGGHAWVDGEKGFGFGRRFVASLRLGGDASWLILVAS